MAKLSVLILTKNEEFDLPGCIESVGWCDDVHVLDSLSTDNTVPLARSLGAHVVQRQFDNYSAQRNFGLHEIAYRHPWVLILDADERVPAALVPVLEAFIASAPADVVAGRIRRRDIWWGRWLKHAQISPYFLRIVRPRRVRYEREVNEVMKTDGAVRDLEGHFDHYPFSKGLGHWLAKHNVYSRMEAEVIAAGDSFGPSVKRALFGRDFNERRRHQKALFYRMPARPLLKFGYMMFARAAFLDGLPGIRYAVLQSVYEYLIVLKTKELLQQQTINPSE